MASKSGKSTTKKKANSQTKKNSTSKKNTSSKKQATTKSNHKAEANSLDFLGKEVFILFAAALCVLMALGNFGLAGFIGDIIRAFMLGYFGWIAYAIPFALLFAVIFLVSNRGDRRAYIKTGAGVVLTLLLCIVLELVNGHGGVIGAKVCDLTEPAIGLMGSYVIVVILMILCLVLITEKSILKGVKNQSEKVYDRAYEGVQRGTEIISERREAIRQEKNRRNEFVLETLGRDSSEVRNAKPSAREKRSFKGVSFDTSMGWDLNAGEMPDYGKDSVATEFKKRSASKVTEEAERASQMTLDDIVINRSVPAYVREITPSEEEQVVPEPVMEAPKKKRASKKASADKTEAEKAEKNMTKEEKEATDKAVADEIQKELEKPKTEYIFPPLSLLRQGNGGMGDSDQHLRETALKLQQTLETFGVNAKVTNVSCGPSVTRYELQPELGVKVSKIVSLADDIKLNLAAADIRIEAPIPGKSAVGIEVPNKENATVMLRDLIDTDEFRKSKSNLSFATGRDISGSVVVSDIAKMPHLLVAGATGSGKSVCINTMIMSIIYKAKPEDVKMIMIDPKVVELSVYNGIPHLMTPVVTDPKKAAGTLNWAVSEMMKRYQFFAETNVRDIKAFNARVENLTPEERENSKWEKLPQILIIVDELADLMMVASNEVEEAICRLAQLARAAGIHLVLATQRPSVNVITGLIKANMPSRIAFSVTSGIDSRTILDMVGAEKLLGKGDMLFYPAGYTKPVRVQGAFVSDEEIQNVVEFIKDQHGSAEYDAEIQKQITSCTSAAGTSGSGAGEYDAYFVDAGKFIIEKDKASIGMLQRVFKIGFNRAARIMDQLAQAGVVGEEEGTKPRKVLMSMEQFEQYVEDYV